MVDVAARRACEHVNEGFIGLSWLRVMQCKPGMMYREIGRVVSSVADKYGYALGSALYCSSQASAVRTL